MGVYVTTYDNPWDPVTQWDDWMRRDMDLGYNSVAYLDRITDTNDDMTEEEYQREMEQAIDRMVMMQPELYKKIKK